MKVNSQNMTYFFVISKAFGTEDYNVFSVESFYVGRYWWVILGDLNLCLDREHLVTLARYAGAQRTGTMDTSYTAHGEHI